MSDSKELNSVKETKWQTAAHMATVLGVILAMAATGFAYNAWTEAQSASKSAQETADQALLTLQEAQKSNKASAIQELYNQERWWFDRCYQNPVAFSLFCSTPESISDERYIASCLEAIAGSLFVVSDVHQLYWQTWNMDGFSPDRSLPQGKLREVYDVAESVLYCIDTCFGFKEDGIFSEAEFLTWSGMLLDIGPHPMLLCAIEVGHQQRYFSREFGQFLIDELSKHPRINAARAFYPDMFLNSEQWLSELIPFGENTTGQIERLKMTGPRPRPQPKAK